MKLLVKNNKKATGIAVIAAPFMLLIINALLMLVSMLILNSKSVEEDPETVPAFAVIINILSLVLGGVGVLAIIPCLIIGILILTKK
jgi:hypothetical protein